jgi:hypothetical protein
MSVSPVWGLVAVAPGMVTLGKKEYRVTLALGDIDALCAPSADKVGRQERLQLIGAFMEPLGTPDVDTRYASAFKHYSAQVSTPPAADGDAEAALVTATKSEILVVDGAAAGAASELPAAGQFAKIRLPGGFAFVNSKPFDYPVPQKYRFDAEKKYFDANLLLGALPITAKVEQRASSGGAWAAAPAGIKVHFQLVEPDPLVAGAASTGGELRSKTRVIGGKGPKGYVEDRFAEHPAQAGDPQADNTVVDLGGKRKPGAGVAGDYFETAARKGFNSDIAVPFPVAAESPHTLAVVADTNANGEAGAIFRPSRQGGDRFKLRAFLDPIGPGGSASDGTDAAAVRADTGTMVVWRTLRISGYHQFNYPASFNAASRAALGGNLDDIDFAKVAEGYKPTYIELTVEPTGKIVKHRIGDAVWRQATDYALSRTRSQPQDVSQRYDVGALFLTVNNTSCLLNLQQPGPYVAAKGAAFPDPPAAAKTRNDDWQGMVDEFMAMFMRYFSENAKPGLVVVQAPNGDTISATSDADLTTSGVAVPTRGCYLFYTPEVYRKEMTYNLEANTLHEMGHCLFMPHQWTDRGDNGAVWGGVPAEHDYKDYCIMSYQKNVGNFYDYCGRCNLKLRGWDTSPIKKNNK